MSSRFPIEILAFVLGLAACDQKAASNASGQLDPNSQNTVDSALAPGQAQPAVSVDARASSYYGSDEAVVNGMRLYKAFNCNGCHSNGGGGMAPDLMDDVWIYGGRLEQIHQTIVQGRPNGMPSWGGRLTDEQIWQIAAYVRSMSLPETLAAQNGPTPSQHPAPVPVEADEHAGWAPPQATTNDFTTTIKGP